MDERWEELIPLYVAGLLSEEKRADLEAVIARSEYARQLVEEWKLIARAVQDETSSRATSLPPLSPLIRAQMRSSSNGNAGHFAQTTETALTLYPLKAAQQQRRYQPYNRRQINRFSAALAVAVLLMIFMGGLILRTVGKNSQNKFGSPNHTATLTSEAPTPTYTAIPNISVCNVSSATTNDINVYRDPNSNSEIIAKLSADIYLQSDVSTGDGWYGFMFNSERRWVKGSDIKLTGSCENLPVLPHAAPDTENNP